MNLDKSLIKPPFEKYFCNVAWYNPVGRPVWQCYNYTTVPFVISFGSSSINLSTNHENGGMSVIPIMYYDVDGSLLANTAGTGSNQFGVYSNSFYSINCDNIITNIKDNLLIYNTYPTRYIKGENYIDVLSNIPMDTDFDSYFCKTEVPGTREEIDMSNLESSNMIIAQILIVFLFCAIVYFFYKLYNWIFPSY